MANKRFYVGCPTCHYRRMQLIAKSTVAAERRYRCSNCDTHWTLFTDTNALSKGWSVEFPVTKQEE